LSWSDRLAEAAYTSPTGTRQTFLYEDVSKEVDKRTAAFTFPGVDGTYVQDNGQSERRFPLRCIFSGADCDQAAEAFEALLLERGQGSLEHPLYGKKNVVPYGTITRRDDLTNAANQAIIEVTFWSTVGAIYPSSGFSAKGQLFQSLGNSSEKLSHSFSKAMKLDTEARRAAAKLSVREALRNVQGALARVASATDSVNREFRQVQSDINFGLDVLIGQPLLLARQLMNLATLPARALAGIASRLEAYGNLLARMIGSSVSSPADITVIPALRVRRQNEFQLASLMASAAVQGSVTSVDENTFTAKPEALAAAEAILAQTETLAAWSDQRYGDQAQIDPGEGYQALQETTALAVGFLVEISFSLVPERAIVLDRPRNIIELAAELYGSIDDRLDFLISTNKLTGSGILELPRGRRVVYYA
jgi:prophage DNA circulation protein